MKNNTIHRNTIYIKAIALVDSNAHNKGDLVHFIKKSYGWIMQNDKEPFNQHDYSCFVSTMRNANFYKFIETI